MSAVHVRLPEWSRANPSEERWRALRGVTLDGGGARTLAERLSAARVVEFTELRKGLAVRTFAHVGRLQVGDIILSITPKIPSRDLLRLVRYAFGLRDLQRLAPTHFAKGDDLFQDLLIAQLIAEAREVSSRGIARRYVRREEVLASLRGRIDVAALARSPAAQRLDLPCIHYPRSSNVLLNQVLGAGLRLAGTMATSPQLRSAARHATAQVEEVAQPCRLDRSSIHAAQRAIDRLTAHYAPALTLIALLYGGTMLSLDDGQDVAVPGCLFDMNRFFQALVTRLLSEYLDGYVVRPEFALRDMMAFDPTRNPRGRKSPRPRPDLAILRGDRVEQLLDAKYRDLWEHELPRDMLYQLTIYALSQRVRTAAIVYPTLNEWSRTARIEVRDPMTSAANARVELRPLMLPRLAQLLDDVDVSRHELRLLATNLAFEGTSIVEAARPTVAGFR